jgi:hypothetical protein
MPQEEIDWFMAHFFDKDLPATRPDNLSLPYNSDNPPPSVRETVFLIILQPTINLHLWLLI